MDQKGDIVKSQLLPSMGSEKDSFDSNPLQPGLVNSDMGVSQKGGQGNEDVLRLLMELLQGGSGQPPQPPPMGGGMMPPMGAV